MTAPEDNPAAELVSAIHTGDIEGVTRLVSESPALACATLGGPFETRTALHVVCDRPVYFPKGPEIARVLIAAGADPNSGIHSQGPRRRCTGQPAATMFTELRRMIEGISQRTRTLRLRQLERDGLVSRTVYPVVPPRVDYELTALGGSLLEAVSLLVGWTRSHRDQIAAARTAYDTAGLSSS